MIYNTNIQKKYKKRMYKRRKGGRKKTNKHTKDYCTMELRSFATG